MDPTLLLKAHERLQRCMADDRDGENPDDPSTVQSMPIILNIPKVNPPVKTDLLEAAAKATVACCLDDRAGGDTAYAEALQSMVRGSGRSPVVPAIPPGIMCMMCRG